MAFFVFAGILTVCLVIGVRRQSATARQRRPEPSATEQAEQEAPHLPVVAIGPKGSGKSMFLASMFSELQTQGRRSYYLTAPHDQVITLGEWRRQAGDTAAEWPAGSTVADTRTFTFTVRTPAAPGRTIPLMHLDWLDYSGGLLTERATPGSGAAETLLERIAEAAALIVIVDGHRIRQWADGNPDGENVLDHYFSCIKGLVEESPCPITFLVTKWDLLEDLDADENARLQTVRKLLMLNRRFHDLVHRQLETKTVRLIPVSAVGPDFAALAPDGRMAKLAGRRMHPGGVDVPIAALVPDLLEQVCRSTDDAALQRRLDQLLAQSRIGVPGAEPGSVGRAGGLLGRLAAHAGILGGAVTELLLGRGDERRERLAQLSGRLSSELRENRRARQRLIRDFQSRVDVLEGRLPATRLTGED